MTATMVDRRLGADRSVKYAWEMADGATVESVAFWKDASWVAQRRAAGEAADVLHVCLSSQVGCNVGCRFCATGLQRSSRSLTASEILAQLDGVLADSGDVDAPGVTFAGMGEPLLNYPAVLDAVRAMLADPRVANVTVSSVGIPSTVRRFAREALPVRLFLSLHAPDDALRRDLIPFAEHFPLAEVIDAGREYAAATGLPVQASYLLLAGVNDRPDQAAALAEQLDPECFDVQVLLWNTVPGLDFVRVDDGPAERFAAVFREHGLHAYVMGSKARDIEGACGQLVGARGRR